MNELLLNAVNNDGWTDSTQYPVEVVVEAMKNKWIKAASDPLRRFGHNLKLTHAGELEALRRNNG